MVRKISAVFGLSLSLAGIISVCPAVRAQSVLEQMENEVAAIAARTTSAVVTISGDQSPYIETAVPIYNYRVERVSETPAQAKKRAAADAAELNKLGVAYDNLDRAETGERAKRKILLKTYGEKSIIIQQQDAKIAALKKRLDEALAKFNAKRAAVEQSARVMQYHIYRMPDTPYGQPAPVFRPLGPVTYLRGKKTGSGFSIGDGYIVTTADVLDGMFGLIVTTDRGIRARAQIVGVNKEWNVGLIKLAEKVDLPALTLGDSAKVAVGHFAISVGEQSGQTNAAALLLVGGLKADGVSAGGHYYPNLIQIAGTVGAESGGSPLVNSRGEIIGVMAGVLTSPQTFVSTSPLSNLPINTTIYPGTAVQWNDILKVPGAREHTPVPQTDAAPQKLNEIRIHWQDAQDSSSAAPATSAGFAVPINELKPILDELKNGKAIGQGWIGIAPKDDVTTSETGGIVTTTRRVIVEGVYPDSPASVAKIMPGDEVVSINGKLIHSANDVREVSQNLRPGEKVKFRYVPKALGSHRYILEIEITILERPAVYGDPLVLQAEKDFKAKD